MVCPVARGKMAVLARCIMGDGLLQSRTDKVGDTKLLAQDIYREFCEADEPNLLNEEDMHIFGLKPLTDELHLVSCNACKKPIMASQYLAHAEICKLLGSSFKATLESDGPTRNKRPHCKERKKSLRSTSRKPAGVDNGHIVKGPHAVPQNGGYSACSMQPPMKRPKLIAGHHPSERDGSWMMSGSMKAILCDISPSHQEMLRDYPVGKSKSTEVNAKGQFSAGIPAPLASKIYYSQRSSRLRFVLAESHYTVATEGLSSSLDPREQCTVIPTDPGPFLRRGSELYPDTSLGCVQTSNGSNHLSDTALRPEDFPFPLVGKNLSPTLHSFAGESGKSLPAQQPNGSVPIT
ncbi:hypothetical protein MLD38_020507 [Melastoma candidum]|uniref:Uncharacterized protein n=1 Tax=Melastoma candidum TaxID=119954 RepID=A0ACB9QDE4_9MYRT|nr:hypothetical protein MLD38_020507 [Melastoma candidum]